MSLVLAVIKDNFAFFPFRRLARSHAQPTPWTVLFPPSSRPVWLTCSDPHAPHSSPQNSLPSHSIFHELRALCQVETFCILYHRSIDALVALALICAFALVATLVVFSSQVANVFGIFSAVSSERIVWGLACLVIGRGFCRRDSKLRLLQAKPILQNRLQRNTFRNETRQPNIFAYMLVSYTLCTTQHLETEKHFNTLPRTFHARTDSVERLL